MITIEELLGKGEKRDILLLANTPRPWRPKHSGHKQPGDEREERRDTTPPRLITRPMSYRRSLCCVTQPTKSVMWHTEKSDVNGVVVWKDIQLVWGCVCSVHPSGVDLLWVSRPPLVNMCLLSLLFTVCIFTLTTLSHSLSVSFLFVSMDFPVSAMFRLDNICKSYWQMHSYKTWSQLYLDVIVCSMGMRGQGRQEWGCAWDIMPRDILWPYIDVFFNCQL